MDVDAGSLWQFLNWGDSGLPSGGFALSHGLETLVEEGRVVTVHEVGQSLSSLLHEVAGGELIAFWHVASRTDLWAGVNEAQRRLDILPRPDEVRQASRWQGGRMLEIAVRMSGKPLGEGTPDNLFGGVAAAVLSRILHMNAGAMATTYLYTVIREMATAATRLIRLDPLAVTQKVWALQEEVAAAVRQAQHSRLSDMGGISPWLAIASMRHQRQSMRLFRT